MISETKSTTTPSDIEFHLNKEFLNKFIKLKPKFGFNGLGELIYYRTYSRLKDDNTKECFQETIQRVVEGCYNTLKKHIIIAENKIWDDNRAQNSAQEMYKRLFEMKFLPGGRGLWAQNTPIIKKGLAAALYNCAFVSTKDIDQNPTEPFEFFMDALCLGVGVGFDSRGANKIKIRELNIDHKMEVPTFIHLIDDSRDGWVTAVKKLLEYFLIPLSLRKPIFDYSAIRSLGTPLKTFGGVASGPKPLIELLEMLDSILTKDQGKLFGTRQINDVFCLIAKCVVSGNIRRSSSLSLSYANDEEFINLKNYKMNPEREAFGW